MQGDDNPKRRIDLPTRRQYAIGVVVLLILAALTCWWQSG